MSLGIRQTIGQPLSFIHLIITEIMQMQVYLPSLNYLSFYHLTFYVSNHQFTHLPFMHLPCVSLVVFVLAPLHSFTSPAPMFPLELPEGISFMVFNTDSTLLLTQISRKLFESF